MLGMLAGRKVAFLARHGRGHKIMPTELNFRANIHGMKQLGVDADPVRLCRRLAEGRACAARFRYARPVFRSHQKRISTFFGEGIVAHVAFGDPSADVAKVVTRRPARKPASTSKLGGTYICMEGPQFSTKAESNLYR